MTPWDDEGENSLMLFTVAEYEMLPDGIELECIDGETAVKGKDYIDMDTRFGHIAFGVRDPYHHAEKYAILTTILKSQKEHND